MTALMGLQFRIIRRGMVGFAQGASLFLVVAAALAFSRSGPRDEAFTTAAAIPLALALIGLSIAASSAETMAWFVPLAPTARVWARLGLFALSGVATTSLILIAMGLCHVAPKVDWYSLAMSLWVCWVGGGLLVLFMGDFTRSANPGIATLGLLAAGAPGIGMSCYHLVEKLPWEILFAEAAVTAVVFVLSLVTLPDEELHRSGEMPSTEAPPAPATPAKLDRVASLAPVMWWAIFRYRITWTMAVITLLLSLFPSATGLAIFSLIFTLFGFQGALNYWRPFQATPLSRPKAFFMLTGPTLALWALSLGLQSISFPLWERDPLIQELPGHEPGTIGLRLPRPRRNPDAEISPLLRKSGGAMVPDAPEQAAALVNEFYKVSYGLDVPAHQILALREGQSTRPWLEAVERRWSGAVSSRLIEWRILLSTAMLTCALLAMGNLLPGRWPAWLHDIVSSAATLIPMMVFVVHSLEVNVMAMLAAPFRPVYVAVFDRPLMLAGVCGVVSVALYLRHLRVFCTHELADPARRP